jgi:hypothetical protein
MILKEGKGVTKITYFTTVITSGRVMCPWNIDFLTPLTQALTPAFLQMNGKGSGG